MIPVCLTGANRVGVVIISSRGWGCCYYEVTLQDQHKQWICLTHLITSVNLHKSPLIFAWRLARSWLALWPWLRIIWHCSTRSLSFHQDTLLFSVVLEIEQRSRKEILVTRVFLLLCFRKVAQTGLKIYGPPASASWMLDWQVRTNKPVYKVFMKLLILVPYGRSKYRY